MIKTCSQPQCAPVDAWGEKTWYTYTVQHYLGIKKKILPFERTLIDLEVIVLNEMSDRKIQILYTFHLHVESKQTELRETEQTLFAKHEGGRWGKWLKVEKNKKRKKNKRKNVAPYFT